MMEKKIWQVDEQSLHPLVEKYTVSDDYLVDQKLLPYDIEASLAHAEMLFDIDVLSKKELRVIQKALGEIMSQWEKGSFIVKKEQEDGHTAIEQYLTENYGDVGKKIHTGRSRNDQSLVMIRLYMKDKLKGIQNASHDLIKVLDKKIRMHENVPMPGYTHMQKAMPTTVGVWLDSYKSALYDFDIMLKSTFTIIDQNPLGSASGFGIENFPLDRSVTTKNLGFKKTQKNPMYCGLSRGYFENIVLQTLSQPMNISAKFACDMLLFTMQEFNYFSLSPAFTTGSSIMPQKRNYDLFEIMRGNTKTFHTYQNTIQNIVSNIGSGYQRDLQLTKKPFINGVELCHDTIEILATIIESLNVNKDRLQEAMSDDIYVTNDVYELVKHGKSFREAYIAVKEKIMKNGQ